MSDWIDFRFEGYARVSRINNETFELSTGQSFFPVGENMCWNDGGVSSDYQKWLTQLSNNGGNYIRLWLDPSTDFTFETKATGVGNYSLSELFNLIMLSILFVV